MTSIHSRRYQQFLRRLRAARKEAGLTQTEVGRKLKRPQSFISKSEAGERKVDVIELADFAKLYKRPLTFFVS